MAAIDPVESRRRRIADFATWCVDSGRGSVRPWLRRPVTALRVVADARRLPVLDARLSTSREADLIRRGLTRTRRTFTAVDSLAGVLALPTTLEGYVQTPARRPVRRKVRVAHRVPVTWRPVSDEAERRALLELADARERIHPDEQYRHEVPDLGDLLDVRLWLVAEGPEGALMLVVIPVDGEWATLRYFRTLVDGDAASVARYLMTEVLVGQLIERGVRHLADTESPFVLPNGLRHFQRMVGFELYRVRLRPGAASEAPVASPYSVA
ncbi:hypothetical protein [Amnibacterium endophyticum]|uniref:GNAT family N-acetyltransferase n=1 Tax=Amnibacterium endophyticum TaxID=2109337 RepID=A0ABW4LAY1_9MICO